MILMAMLRTDGGSQCQGLGVLVKQAILAQSCLMIPCLMGQLKSMPPLTDVKTVGADIQDFITTSEAFMGCSFEEATRTCSIFP